MPKNNKQSVRSLVNGDLEAKLTNGYTLEQLKQVSQCEIESYHLYITMTYSHLANRPIKQGTVNRYLEQWLKAKGA